MLTHDSKMGSSSLHPVSIVTSTAHIYVISSTPARELKMIESGCYLSGATSISKDASKVIDVQR